MRMTIMILLNCFLLKVKIYLALLTMGVRRANLNQSMHSDIHIGRKSDYEL